MRWLIDWNLAFDPFHPPRRIYIPTPVHEESVQRIAHAFASGGLWGSMIAPSGYGKTAIVDEAIVRIKGPKTSAVRVDGAIDGPSLYAQIAAALGRRVPPEASLATAWRALREARRLRGAMRMNVFIVIDNVHMVCDPESLLRLAALESSPASRTFILTCGRPQGDFEISSYELNLSEIERSGTQIRPRRLSRDETDAYLNAKLAAAGAAESRFSPRAVSRIHVHSKGIPRSIDRLAKRSLIVASEQGAEIVGPPLVDSIALESDADYKYINIEENAGLI